MFAATGKIYQFSYVVNWTLTRTLENGSFKFQNMGQATSELTLFKNWEIFKLAIFEKNHWWPYRKIITKHQIDQLLLWLPLAPVRRGMGVSAGEGGAMITLRTSAPGIAWAKCRKLVALTRAIGAQSQGKWWELWEHKNSECFSCAYLERSWSRVDLIPAWNDQANDWAFLDPDVQRAVMNNPIEKKIEL